MKNNQQNASSSSGKKKKKDPSFKFVDMTSEWEPCMSGIRKEKKYFQLRKQLKGCENFQENYFVISMPKKRKGDDDDEDQDNNNNDVAQPSSQMHDFNTSNTIPPNINTSNMNIPIINTRNILRFETSTPNNNQFTFVSQPPNPPVKTLPNGLVEYNNVKISTSSFEVNPKKKKRKSNPPPPNIQENPPSPYVNNNQYYPPPTTPNYNYEYIANGSIISADFVDDDFESYNFSDAQILDAGFIPFSPIDSISMSSSHHANPLPELDTVSISFSEPISFGSDFNFDDLPDLELGSAELGICSSGMR